MRAGILEDRGTPATWWPRCSPTGDRRAPQAGAARHLRVVPQRARGRRRRGGSPVKGQRRRSGREGGRQEAAGSEEDHQEDHHHEEQTPSVTRGTITTIQASRSTLSPAPATSPSRRFVRSPTSCRRPSRSSARTSRTPSTSLQVRDQGPPGQGADRCRGRRRRGRRQADAVYGDLLVRGRSVVTPHPSTEGDPGPAEAGHDDRSPYQGRQRPPPRSAAADDPARRRARHRDDRQEAGQPPPRRPPSPPRTSARKTTKSAAKATGDGAAKVGR